MCEGGDKFTSTKFVLDYGSQVYLPINLKIRCSLVSEIGIWHNLKGLPEMVDNHRFQLENMDV